MSKGAKVIKQKAEELRRKLIELDLFDANKEPERDHDHVYFPLKEGEYARDLEVVDMVFKDREQSSGSYLDKLDLPGAEEGGAPRSMDIVGDIAILRIDEGMKDRFADIGKAVMGTNPHVNTVLRDKGVKGDWRVRDLELIYGDPETETEHREHGCVYKLDVTKVYFSPRLATERSRVAGQVDTDETIVDMFAGVGPFSIMIAKNRNPRKIWAFDLNPSAICYLKRNIKFNKVRNIKCKEGDAVALIQHIGEVDRAIMNLPHDAKDFLIPTLNVVRQGGMINYYEILERENLEKRKRSLESIVVNGKMLKIDSLREVRNFSPSSAHYGFDLRVVNEK